MAKAKPDVKFEKQVWKKKYSLVIGVDEVGRGAVAGPVVAGAVAMRLLGHSAQQNFSQSPAMVSSKSWPALSDYCKILPTPTAKNLGLVNWETIGIDDSKRLTPKRREELAKIIHKYTLWGIGEVGVAYINSHGIVKATEKAMRQAIKHVVFRASEELQATSNGLRAFVLVDAFHVKYIPGVGLKNQRAIIKGDQKSVSIAAASIIAKVYRDRAVRNLSKHPRYKKYSWRENKGYGTVNHIKAIRKYGVTKLHRTDFVKNFMKAE